MVRIFPYEDLPDSDLIVDAIYEAKETGSLKGEAISRLPLGIGSSMLMSGRSGLSTR